MLKFIFFILVFVLSLSVLVFARSDRSYMITNYYQLNSSSGGNGSFSKIEVKGTTIDNKAFLDVGLDFRTITEPVCSNMNLVLIEGGNLEENATYYYFTSYTSNIGETDSCTGESYTIITNSTHKGVNVTLTASDDYRTSGINLYRSKGNEPSYLVGFLTSFSNVNSYYEDYLNDSYVDTNNKIKKKSDTTNKLITIDDTTALFMSARTIAIGKGALEDYPAMIDSVVVGSNALPVVTIGERNNVMGYGAFLGATSAGTNNAIGFLANAKGSTPNGNNIMGYDVLYYPDDADYNDIIGYMGGFGTSSSCLSPDYNVGMGYQTMRYLCEGDYNVCLGGKSCFDLEDGRYNIAIGWEADVPDIDGSSQLNIGDTITGKLTRASDSNVTIETDLYVEGDLEVHGNVYVTGCVRSNGGSLGTCI